MHMLAANIYLKIKLVILKIIKMQDLACVLL